jgi:hypothetical protein
LYERLYSLPSLSTLTGRLHLPGFVFCLTWIQLDCSRLSCHQSFGALLLASQERLLYKRVATDSFIKVQIREETALEELMGSVRTVDVQ